MKLLSAGIILTVLLLSEARNEEDGRIVAAYSTKTAYSITTSTTTIPLTCASAGNGAVCRKRRYRRYAAEMEMLKDLKYPEHDLEGTLEEDPDIGVRQDRSVNTKEEEDESRKGRIAITVWTTLSSTYTVTSTSINSAVTFSISYYCTFAGANMAPSCG